MAELFDAVETLALTRAQQGDRLAILTNGGGPGMLATDALVARGGRLAALSSDTVAPLDRVLPRTWNPIDVMGDAPGQRYADALSILLRDRNVDAILVLNCPTGLTLPGEAARAVIDTLAAARAEGPGEYSGGRNVFTAWLGEHSAAEARHLFVTARIPTYDTPDSAVRGFMHRVQHRRNQELLMETPAARTADFAPDIARAHNAITSALSVGRTWLEMAELNAALDAYGVPLPTTRLVADAEGAAAAAAEIGHPVALKIRLPNLTHKGDVGGVALDLDAPDRVRSEARSMLTASRASAPTRGLTGFSCSRWLSSPARSN